MAFGKNNCANPAGRPKSKYCISDIVKNVIRPDDWIELTGRLQRIILNSPDEKASIAAYNTLADRAFGKPAQVQIVRQEVEPPIEYSKMNELRRQMFGDAAPIDEPTTTQDDGGSDGN
jgi:hypothetical protein